MRQSIKVEAPAVIRGFSMSESMTCSVRGLQNTVIIKKSENDALKIIGKYKSSDLQSLAELYIASFKNRYKIGQHLDITIKVSINPILKMGTTEAMIAALSYALHELFRLGLSKEEIYTNDKFFIDESSYIDSAVYFTSLKGGFYTAIPEKDIFQKIYTPTGLSLAIITLDNYNERMQPELIANFVLALSHSEIDLLPLILDQIQIPNVPQEIINANTMGIMNHGQTPYHIILCQNALVAENIGKNIINEHQPILLEFDTEGALMF